MSHHTIQNHCSSGVQVVGVMQCHITPSQQMLFGGDVMSHHTIQNPCSSGVQVVGGGVMQCHITPSQQLLFGAPTVDVFNVLGS